MNNRQVRSFSLTADVVGTAERSLLEHEAKGIDVILDEEPVAHIRAVSIDRQRLLL